MTKEVREWYEMAAADLGVAKHLDATYYPKPLEIICSFLLNQIKNKVSIEEKFYDYADTLTPYGVAVRYPKELFQEERHVKEAL